MSTLKTNYENLVEKLSKDGKIVEMGDAERKTILSGIKLDFENYWLEGQLKQQDSLQELSSLILTS